MGNKSSTSSNHAAPLEATPFSEIRSLRRIHRTDECIGTDGFDILAMKGIVHPETKEILTVEEAIRLRILDVRTGKIAVNPKSKSTYISIEEAVHKKLVIPELAEKLLGPCGIVQDGRGQMSLLEAIQRELIDAERGPMERLKVNTSTDSIADEGGPSVFTFESIPPTLETKLSLVNLPLTLYDLLCLDLVDRHSGLIFDRDTGRRCTIEEAVQKRILNPSVREIVDTAADDKVTISEALQRQLVKNGKFLHKLSNEVISFHEAKRRRLIIRPLSLKECVELEVLSESRLFKSPIYCADLSLADAIKRAVVDFDAHKTVVNKAEDHLTTLAQAMQDGIITADASYVDKSTNETISIAQAVERGLLYSVSIKSVFNLAVFQKAEDQFVSFNEAFDKDLVKYENGIILYARASELIPVSEAVGKGFVRADILSMLNKTVGMFADEKELTVIEAALTGRLNPITGLPINPHSQVDVPFIDAVEQKLITEEGVVTLKSLLAISLSTQTITRTVVTYATSVRFPAVDQQITKTLPVGNIEAHITPNIEVAKPGTSSQALWAAVMNDTGSSQDHSRLLGKLGIGLSPIDGDNQLKLGHSPRDEVPPTVIKKIVLGESPSDENAFKTVEVMRFADEAASTSQFSDITCDSEHQYTSIKKIKLGESPSDDQNRSVIFEEGSKSPLQNVHKSSKIEIIKVGDSPRDEVDGTVISDETKAEKSPSDDALGKSFSSTAENMEKIKLPSSDIKSNGAQSPTDKSKDSSAVSKYTLNDHKLQSTSAAISPTKSTASGESTKASKSKKSPIKKTLMKMLKPLRMKDTKDRSSLIEHVDMPSEGWSLKEAIEKNYFDPATGLLIIPGTDRQVSFEECIQLQIIDPASALVIEPAKNRKISLKKALDKQVLNCTGMYRALLDGKSITMQEALQKSLVIYKGDTARLSVSPSTESGEPADSAVTLEPIRIQPDVIFDPETALLIFVKSNSSDEICSAVKTGKIDPSQVKIKLESGVESDLGTAVRNGSIDLNTRQYVSEKGCRIDFNDAIKSGLVELIGYPLVAAKSVDSDSSLEAKNELKTAPLASLSSDEDECGPSLAELTRNRVTTEPKYLVSIGKAKSVTQTANVARPVLLQKMRKKRVKPKDAIPAGIIDRKTADLLESLGNIKNSDGKCLDLFEALDLTQANPNAKVIKDPRTRDMISIKEAVARGILDQYSSSVELLVPVAKSLSLPDLLRQGLIENGKIIHPETGNNLSLQEAIACDIADPLSKIKDPATGNILTLKDAMDSGVVGGNLEIRSDGVDMNVAEAASKGNIFVEEPVSEVKLPPVAMTLSVAQDKGLYDVANNCMRRPLTGELIPLQKAIEEGLIMAIPDDKSVEGVEIIFDDTVDLPRKVLTLDTEIYDEESNTSFTLADAAKANLIDLKTGQLKDGAGETGTRMKETLKKGLMALVGAPIVAGAMVANILQGDTENESKSVVTQQKRPSALPKSVADRSVHLNKHVSPESFIAEGMYDKKKRKFLDPKTGREVDFTDFITNETLLQPDRVFVKDPSENTYIPLHSALTMNVFDADGCITDPDTGKKISFFESLKLGWITELGAEDDSHLPREYSSAKEIQINSPADLKCCLKSGNGDLVLVRSPSSPNGVLSLTQAIDAGIVDLNEEVVHDGTGKPHDLVSAFEDGLIFPRRIPMSLVAAVQNGYYSSDENGIYDAAVKKYVPLEEAVKRHIIDPALCECKDLKSDQFIPLVTALDCDLISQGCLVNTISEKPIKLDTAVDQKLIINRPFSINLVEAVALKYYEPKSRKIFNSCTGNFQTVQKAIESHFIDVTPIKVRDAKHNEYLPLYQAVSNNIIDLEQGMMLVPTEMTLDKAVKKQFLAIGELPVLADDVERPQLDLDSSLEVIEELPEWSNLVIKVGGKLLNFQQALDEGMVDMEKQTIQLDGQAVPVNEAFKSGLLVEVERPMALKDVISRSLFDERTALFYDPDFGKGVTLAEAVKYNLICPFSVTVKEIPSKSTNKQPPKKLNLNDALRSSIVDGKTARVKKGKSEVPLLQAYDDGLITDTQQQIPLQKALSLGFYDENDGKIVDPNNGDRITLEEALKRRVLNAKVPCYWDDNLKMLLSLNNCLIKGIVNAEAGTFRAPLSNVTMNLMDAQKCGYIVKIDRMGLHEAAATGFFQRGLMAHPENNRYLTLREAIAEHLIDPEASLVRSSKQNAFVEVTRAIELRVIDDVAGYYVDPATNERLWFAEAQARSYIIPNLSKSSPQKTAMEPPCAGLYIEPAALAPSKSKTSLVTPEHIRLEDAIKLEYLRPETAVLKTLYSAPHEYCSVKALLDSHELEPSTELTFVSTLNAQLPRQKAVCCKGALFVKKPIPFLEAIQNDTLRTEDCKFVVDEKTGLSLPLKEAISGGFVDADLVLVKDHANKRLLSVMESFQKGIFDGVKNTIVDTRTSRLLNLQEALHNQLIVTDGLSLLDALEFGLYNPHTGRFVDPFRAAVDRAAPSVTAQPLRVLRKCDLTLQNAIDSRVVDPSSIVVRGADGAILTFEQAVEKYTLDPVAGKLFDATSGKSIDLLAANNRRLILSTTSRVSALFALPFQSTLLGNADFHSLLISFFFSTFFCLFWLQIFSIHPVTFFFFASLKFVGVSFT